MTKEIAVDPENDGATISKTTIEYHENKGPNNKRKASDDDDDDFNVSFVDWFGDDDVRAGIILSEDIFPSAVEYYQGPGESDDDEDENGEIDLDLSDSEDDDDEEEKPKSKKSRK